MQHTSLNTAVVACLLFSLLCVKSARPADGPEAGDLSAKLLELAVDSPKARKAAIDALAQTGDHRLIAFFDDYSKGNAYLYKNQIVIALDAEPKEAKRAKLLDPLTRETLPDGTVAKTELKELDVSNRERMAVRDGVVKLRLNDPADDARLSAIVKIGDGENTALIPALNARLEVEQNSKIKLALEESIAVLTLSLPAAKPDELEKAIARLGALHSGRALSKLKTLKSKTAFPQLQKPIDEAIGSIESHESWGRGVSYVFSGLSLGSILVLMALGLSIIFGLMGVINMAHGELMMIGAYATFLTQRAFEFAIASHWLPPSAFNWYFVMAMPLAFLASAVVGYMIERLVIRHLYGRPLETLLATYGISLILIQLVRLEFGDNIAVNSPTWLQGGAEVMSGVILPYNRLFIIVFCAVCVSGMYLLIGKTNLGLLLRATTQNRNMAAALGVQTRRVDGYTFALGAGLAGCALTQIGGVTPDMGQNYIVDSFMVVVTGGVGKLAGAILAGMTLGSLNKILEPFFQAVWAKVLILLFVVVFIQWRPSGFFPAKGRLADV